MDAEVDVSRRGLGHELPIARAGISTRDVEFRGFQDAVARVNRSRIVVGIDDGRRTNLGEGPVSLRAESSLAAVSQHDNPGIGHYPGPPSHGTGPNRDGIDSQNAAKSALLVPGYQDLDISWQPLVRTRGGGYVDGHHGIGAVVAEAVFRRETEGGSNRQAVRIGSLVFRVILVEGSGAGHGRGIRCCLGLPLLVLQ